MGSAMKGKADSKIVSVNWRIAIRRFIDPINVILLRTYFILRLS
jgi:hypothetical protein